MLQLSTGRQELYGESIDTVISGSQFEELVNELNLAPNIRAAQPPNLSVADHGDGPESFAVPPGILGSPAWPSRDAGSLGDPAPRCGLSTAQLGADNGDLAFLASVCRESPRSRSVPDPCEWPEAGDGTDNSVPCETTAWWPRRRGALTAASRWSRLWNRWPGRASTSGPGTRT